MWVLGFKPKSFARAAIFPVPPTSPHPPRSGMSEGWDSRCASTSPALFSQPFTYKTKLIC